MTKIADRFVCEYFNNFYDNYTNMDQFDWFDFNTLVRGEPVNSGLRNLASRN